MQVRKTWSKLSLDLLDDNRLRGLKHNFNERTAEVVEQAMEELVTG